MRPRLTALAPATTALLLSTALISSTAPTAYASETGARGPSGARACFDTATAYAKPAGNYYVPPNSDVLTATAAANCADINIKPDVAVSVRVCFLPSSGGGFCQTAFKPAAAGVWTAIATDVSDTTNFFFEFSTTTASTGVWAA